MGKFIDNVSSVPFTQQQYFSNVKAQEYGAYDDDYNDDRYSTYPTDDKKYECRTGPFEGFFVSSVEFCKHVQFDKDKMIEIEIIEQEHKMPHPSRTHQVYQDLMEHKVYQVYQDLMEHKVYQVVDGEQQGINGTYFDRCIGCLTKVCFS